MASIQYNDENRIPSQNALSISPSEVKEFAVPAHPQYRGLTPFQDMLQTTWDVPAGLNEVMFLIRPGSPFLPLRGVEVYGRTSISAFGIPVFDGWTRLTALPIREDLATHWSHFETLAATLKISGDTIGISDTTLEGKVVGGLVSEMPHMEDLRYDTLHRYTVAGQYHKPLSLAEGIRLSTVPTGGLNRVQSLSTANFYGGYTRAEPFTVVSEYDPAGGAPVSFGTWESSPGAPDTPHFTFYVPSSAPELLHATGRVRVRYNYEEVLPLAASGHYYMTVKYNCVRATSSTDPTPVVNTHTKHVLNGQDGVSTDAMRGVVEDEYFIPEGSSLLSITINSFEVHNSRFNANTSALVEIRWMDFTPGESDNHGVIILRGGDSQQISVSAEWAAALVPKPATKVLLGMQSANLSLGSLSLSDQDTSRRYLLQNVPLVHSGKTPPLSPEFIERHLTRSAMAHSGFNLFGALKKAGKWVLERRKPIGKALALTGSLGLPGGAALQTVGNLMQQGLSETNHTEEVSLSHMGMDPPDIVIKNKCRCCGYKESIPKDLSDFHISQVEKLRQLCVEEITLRGGDPSPGTVPEIPKHIGMSSHTEGVPMVHLGMETDFDPEYMSPDFGGNDDPLDILEGLPSQVDELEDDDGGLVQTISRSIQPSIVVDPLMIKVHGSQADIFRRHVQNGKQDPNYTASVEEQASSSRTGEFGLTSMAAWLTRGGKKVSDKLAKMDKTVLASVPHCWNLGALVTQHPEMGKVGNYCLVCAWGSNQPPSSITVVRESDCHEIPIPAATERNGIYIHSAGGTAFTPTVDAVIQYLAATSVYQIPPMYDSIMILPNGKLKAPLSQSSFYDSEVSHESLTLAVVASLYGIPANAFLSGVLGKDGVVQSVGGAREKVGMASQLGQRIVLPAANMPRESERASVGSPVLRKDSAVPTGLGVSNLGDLAQSVLTVMSTSSAGGQQVATTALAVAARKQATMETQNFQSFGPTDARYSLVKEILDRTKLFWTMLTEAHSENAMRSGANAEDTKALFVEGISEVAQAEGVDVSAKVDAVTPDTIAERLARIVYRDFVKSKTREIAPGKLTQDDEVLLFKLAGLLKKPKAPGANKKNSSKTAQRKERLSKLREEQMAARAAPADWSELI